MPILDNNIPFYFHYYVDRAMNQLDFSTTSRMAIDETSSRRWHEYVTLFVDIDTKTVMFATEGKGSQGLKKFSDFLQEKEINPENIKEICSDMSPAFIKGVEDEFPDAHITFDTNLTRVQKYLPLKYQLGSKQIY